MIFLKRDIFFILREPWSVVEKIGVKERFQVHCKCYKKPKGNVGINNTGFNIVLESQETISRESDVSTQVEKKSKDLINQRSRAALLIDRHPSFSSVFYAVVFLLLIFIYSKHCNKIL